MRAFQIDYDLHAPDKNYDAVITAIKSLDGWCHVLKSCWLVAGSALTLDNVTATVRAAMDDNDSLIVMNFSRPYYGWLPKRIHDWIETNVPA